MAVLYADIAGFTNLSRQLPPSTLVQLLDLAFSAFDVLAERNRLDKIKSIGDAYLVVSGLSETRFNFTLTVANTGLAMSSFCDELSAALGMSVRLRVGIQIGPIMGGVIGLHRPIFDVWGDTVNVAKRMESTGASGRVQITAEAMARGREEHVTVSRGEIDVKGVGTMATYWLMDRRSPRRLRSDAREIARAATTRERVAQLDPALAQVIRPWLWPEAAE